MGLFGPKLEWEEPWSWATGRMKFERGEMKWLQKTMAMQFLL